MNWIISIIIGIFVEKVYSPRLDWTRDKKLLLWYNIEGGREYKIILKI